MKKLLILAIFLRILVAIFYFQPDIKTYNFQSSFLKKGVFNIYSYLLDNREKLPLKEEFVYFPLTYFVTGGYQIIAAPILGRGFDGWLANASSNGYVADPQVFKYLFLLKLPYLILDIVIAYLLMQFFEDKKKKDMVFTFWLFNPFTIFLIYAYSNVDIIPVFLTLLSFLYLKRNKINHSAILLGLAAGFKLYPLLILPFMFLYGKTIKEKVILVGVPLMIFAAICLPFFGSAFIHSALISGLSTGIFKSELTTLAISILFFYAAFVDLPSRKTDRINIFNYFLVLFLVIFSFSLFHVQWLLWVAPFIVLTIVERPSLNIFIFILVVLSFTIPILYEDRFMTVGLLRVYSLYFDLLPTPFLVLQKIYDPANLLNIAHSGLAGGSVVLASKLLGKDNE